MDRNKSRVTQLRRIALLAVFAAAVLLLPVRASAATSNEHAPIVIQSDADFTSCACVTSGAGTAASPFIIGPWSINNVDGDGVFIDGTYLAKSFVLWNLTVAGNSGSAQRGIALRNINPTGAQNIVAEVKGTQTSIQRANIGILVEFSSYVTLDGGGANPNGAGIANSGAGTINKHVSGAIDIENSSYITVKGWQLSASGGDHQPDWLTLDPSLNFWGVGGVRMFGVTYSFIDHNAVNNCTDVSFSVFNSSHNTLSNNTADYPFTTNFLVTDGSAYNLLSGNVAGTADFIGYLIADPFPGSATLAFGFTHDNTLTNNISHSDGPTGNEIKAGIVPAFVGGFVVLNGTYDNQIINNQSWSAPALPDFVWAQAVPNSGTPIGVDIGPPVLDCNVTASDGGGGVGNLNGNVWTGNAFHTIDACLPQQ